MQNLFHSKRGFPGIMLGMLAFVFLAGCASTPKIDWDSRIGSYTHDQAVIELGPPDKAAKLSDGGIVAEWLTSRQERGRVLYSPGFYGGYYGPRYYGYGGGSYYYTPSDVEWFLRLTFDKDGILQEHKKYVRN